MRGRLARLAVLVALAAVSCDAEGLPTLMSPDDAPRRGSISRREWHNLQYAGTGERQRLDVYLPDRGAGPFPVVVWIHGGSWERGDKSLAPYMAQARLVGAGYAVASINYRYSTEARHPAQVSDAKAAVRYLRAHADALLLDSGRVAAWGGSAGGYLAAMLATTADVPALDDPSLGNAGQSARVQALIAYYPLVDFTTLDAHMQSRGCGFFDGVAWSAAGSSASRMLGFTVADHPDSAAAASPLAYVTPDDPPTFVLHGAADCTVPLPQGLQLYEAMSAVLDPGRVKLRVIPDAGHGAPQFDMPDVAADVAAFLSTHLR
ncbi:MAG TPA: alpha/beta hydrolase [Longimicrobium sp.]